jgi:thiol-disulfide isomerase/thioredoxin
MPKIKVFVSGHCGPCHDIREHLEQGKFAVNGAEGEVEMVDVETEEGFTQIPDSIEGVPAAFQEDGKTCRLRIDKENDVLYLECGEENVKPTENPGA